MNMESDSEALNYYLSELKDTTHDLDVYDEHVLNEAEQASDFLLTAGLTDLTILYKQGCEISENVVNDSVRQRLLTDKQAQTIKSRIYTLNRTLRNRQPRKKQRHDIRDVKWNAETSSIGTRSRSATPDSLDSLGIQNLNDEIISDEDPRIINSLPQFSFFDSSQTSAFKPKLKSTSSEPFSGGSSNCKRFSGNSSSSGSRSRNNRADVAHLDTENVILKGYQPLVESPSLNFFNSNKPRVLMSTQYQRERSGSDPTADLPSTQLLFVNRNHHSAENFTSNQPIQLHLTRSHSNISTRNTCTSLDLIQGSNHPSSSTLICTPNIDGGPVSFESITRENDMNCESYIENWDLQNDIHIDEFNDSEYQYLKPLLFVEIVSIFDQYKITYIRRKSSIKTKGGNVFGANLSTLVMRDMPRPSDTSMVPQILRSLVKQLNERCICEDGILRVACQKHKFETLCNDIEQKFFLNRANVENLLIQATVHELTAVLKKLLRELPDPIFTMELVDMFYKTSLIANVVDKVRALNLLVLLLPIEHRNTFRLLLDFFLNIVKHEKHNRMSLHNVAMITAPSFFPARLLLPKDNKNKLMMKQLSKEELMKEINGAAVCCRIMETMLKAGVSLWTVPSNLVCQAKDAQQKAYNKKDLYKNKDRRTRFGKSKLIRSNTQYETGAINCPRIKRDVFV